jgi:hypothetical protein
MFFQFRSHSTRVSRPPHCPLLSSVSTIWLSSPRITWWVGSAVFWKKCPQQTSGSCTQLFAEQPVPSSSSPAGSLAISWRQVIMKADRVKRVRRPTDYADFLVEARKFTDTSDVRRWMLGVRCFCRVEGELLQTGKERECSAAMLLAKPAWHAKEGYMVTASHSLDIKHD